MQGKFFVILPKSLTKPMSSQKKKKQVQLMKEKPLLVAVSFFLGKHLRSLLWGFHFRGIPKSEKKNNIR